MSFLDDRDEIDEYKVPEVIPNSCKECKYFKKTGVIDIYKGHCNFYDKDRFSNWSCIAQENLRRSGDKTIPEKSVMKDDREHYMKKTTNAQILSKSKWGLVIGVLSIFGGFANIAETNFRLSLGLLNKYTTGCALLAAGVALVFRACRPPMGLGRGLAVWVGAGLMGDAGLYTLVVSIALHSGARLNSAPLGRPDLLPFLKGQFSTVGITYISLFVFGLLLFWLGMRKGRQADTSIKNEQSNTTT